MAAPTYRHHTQLDVTVNAAVYTGTKPTGTAEGDTLLAFATATNGNATDCTPPAGWTELRPFTPSSGFLVAGMLFGKTAGPSEPADYAFTWDGNERGSLVIVAVQAATGNTQVAASGLDASGTGTSHPTPSITVPNTDCLLVTGVFASKATTVSFTHPAGSTERADAYNATNLKALALADVATPGTGSQSLTWTASATAEGIAFIAAVEAISAFNPATVAGSRYYERLRARRGR